MTFRVMKNVTVTSNDPVTFWSHKLVQTDHKSQRDLLGHKVGHGDSNDPVTSWSHKLCQTDQKGHRDFWGHKVGRGDL